MSWFECFKQRSYECIEGIPIQVCCPQPDGTTISTDLIENARTVFWDDRVEQAETISGGRGRDVIVSYRDFALPLSALYINGEFYKPKTGDLVKWDGCEYRLCKRDGLPSVGWHDGHRTCYVLRTALCDSSQFEPPEEAEVVTDDEETCEDDEPVTTNCQKCRFRGYRQCRCKRAN